MTMPKQNSKTRSTAKAKAGTTLRISLNLSVMAPEERILAERDAREGAVVSLWRHGRLSTREAAAELGLDYYDYIDLLGKLGVPVVTGVSDGPLLEAALEEIQRDRSCR